MDTVKHYRVKHIWPTVQGEGGFAGQPAVFVRLVGCNLWSGYEQDRRRDAERLGVHCPLWCDTDFTKEGSRFYTAEALAAEARACGPEIPLCVMTGGEPFLQMDDALVEALHVEGFIVAVETNGSLSLSETFSRTTPDWIVCSPKFPPDRVALEVMDELKLIVPDYPPERYESLIERVRPYRRGGRLWRHLWLQPEDGPRWEEARRLALEWALCDPRWRVSVQAHKVLQVD